MSEKLKLIVRLLTIRLGEPLATLSLDDVFGKVPSLENCPPEVLRDSKFDDGGPEG